MNTVLNNLTVLLADDHAIVRMGFRLLLEGAGAARVQEADSGESALAMYEQAPPDVLVMDISMPGMGGLAALGGRAGRRGRACWRAGPVRGS
jgi:two-component system, NarL family, invasion response regulator UvrY